MVGGRLEGEDVKSEAGDIDKCPETTQTAPGSQVLLGYSVVRSIPIRNRRLEANNKSIRFGAVGVQTLRLGEGQGLGPRESMRLVGRRKPDRDQRRGPPPVNPGYSEYAPLQASPMQSSISSTFIFQKFIFHHLNFTTD